MHCWSARPIAGLLATLPPQKEPRESRGNWNAPPGVGVGGVLARDGSPGLALATGTIAFLRSGVAGVLSGLPLASSQTASNALAANRWPWP